MKTILMSVCGIAVGVALATAGSSADASQNDPQPRERATIVGAWQVEVTVRFDAPDCTTATPVPFGPNPFPSLNTFHFGGTISETGSRSPPSMRSPGHGVWRHVNGKSYEARYTFQGFDANGFLATNMDIRSDITLAQDGETFAGVSRFQFSDASGNVTPFCATLEGVRFSL
jgi:hypothetical protein